MRNDSAIARLRWWLEDANVPWAASGHKVFIENGEQIGRFDGEADAEFAVVAVNALPALLDIATAAKRLMQADSLDDDGFEEYLHRLYNAVNALEKGQ